MKRDIAERYGRFLVNVRLKFFVISSLFALLILAACVTVPTIYQPGDTFRDCMYCPSMVVVPAGSFLMGDLIGDGRQNETPVHSVTIPKKFAVSVFEVSFVEWDSCVSAGGCGEYRPDDRGWGRSFNPVRRVSWQDAKAYISWLREKTGGEYRLLSEAEWEYAARSGTTTRFYYGSSLSPDQANYNDRIFYGNGQSNKTRLRRPRPGKFQPNSFGLYDMHGNVWEWVEDCWNENYDDAPGDGTARLAGSCDRRVIRGGSWYDVPSILRSAYRHVNFDDDRDYFTGFRIAKTLKLP